MDQPEITDKKTEKSILDAIDRIEKRARVLRQFADELIVEATELRAIVRLMAAKGENPSEFPISVARDEREQLASLLGENRVQAEQALEKTNKKISALEKELRDTADGRGTQKIRRSSIPQIIDNPADDHRIPLPSRPPSQPVPPSERQTPAEGLGAEESGENLADMLERSSWESEHDSQDEDSDTRHSVPAETGRKRVSKNSPPLEDHFPPLNIDRMDPEDSDLAGILDRSSWNPEIPGQQNKSYAKYEKYEEEEGEKKEGKLKDLLAGYLKDQD